MRSLLLAACVAVLPTVAHASDTASAVVVVSANFSSRTSLKVSTEILRFDISNPEAPAVVAVDFSAAARVARDGEVMLSVEPLRTLDGPGGAADVETSVTFQGQGEGTTAGGLRSEPTVAGRWVGSGVRTGRLLFSLRSGARGNYTLPVRFVLSTP